MKKILITGGSGALATAINSRFEFLGSHKIFLSARNGNSDSFLFCDVTNKRQFLKVVEQLNPDVIIHLAATFSDDFDSAYQTNVQSTKNILDYIKNNKKNTRVLLIGSASEYGIIRPDENPISEDHFLKPVSVYGITKSWQTQLIGHYTSHGVDIVCARIFNLYGDGLSNKLFAGYFRNQITEILCGKKTEIKVQNLSNFRDYISVSDAADQIIKIVFSGKSGEIYHVASGKPLMMRDFAINQLRLNGLDESVLQETNLFFHSPICDVPIIFADVQKTKKLFSF